MAEKPFRVLLDLTDLHLQSFKYVWISVSPRELKTIADFKQSLFQKINLGTERIQLFVRDGLLLDDETIIILREDDTVKVQHEKDYPTSQEVSRDSTRSISYRKRNFSEYFQENNLDKKNDEGQFIAQSETHLEDATHNVRKKHKKSHISLCDKIINEDYKHNESRKHKKKSKEHSSSMEITSVDLNSHDNYVSFPSLDSHHNTSENCKNDVKYDRKVKDKAAGFVTFEVETEDTLVTESTVSKLDVEVGMQDELNVLNSTTSLTNSCPKKKRKRHRKRKKVDLVDEVLSNGNNVSESITDEVSSVFPEKKHVIYNTCSSEKVEENPKLETTNKSNNCDDTHSTYNMHTENVLITDQKNHHKLYPKVSTPAQLNGCTNPNWQVSLMQNSSIVLPCGEIQSVKKENVKSNKCKNITQENLKKTSGQNSNKNGSCQNLPYSELPSLYAMPAVGAHIVYKVLELNENYSPEVSEYKEGIVKSIDPETDEMEIELLKHEVKPGRTGKFENLKEDEVPLPEVKKMDFVCWTALIDPKLISR